MAIRTLLLLVTMLGANMTQAAINYIGEDQAESVRLCHYYNQQLEEAKSGIRDAIVSGGQKLGSAAVANALRTKMRFKKKFLEQKIAENCAEPDDLEDGSEAEAHANAAD